MVGETLKEALTGVVAPVCTTGGRKCAKGEIGSLRGAVGGTGGGLIRVGFEVVAVRDFIVNVEGELI